MLALAEQTEAVVKKFAAPTTCQVSGKTTVGGRTLACSKQAAVAAALIQKAIDAVPVTYKVGGKTCLCECESKKLAEATNKKVVLCVAGKETTCAVHHRVHVARAQYRAAIAALKKADAKTAR